VDIDGLQWEKTLIVKPIHQLCYMPRYKFMSINKDTFLKFLNDDQDSIGIVYREYKNLMYFVISSYVSVKEDVEDVLEDAFLKILSHREDIPGFRQLKAYIVTTCKHTALDFIKKQNKLIKTDLIDEIYGSSDTYNEVLSYLQPLLSYTETIVIYYRIVFSMEWKEIVNLTGMSESTLRIKYKSALKKLKENYKKHPSI